MKIIIDNKIPFIRGVFEPYADEVLYLPGKETTAEIVRDADALVTRTRTICNAGLLEGSKVKVIATATIGFDHIDTAWCEANGIIWANAPGCNSGSVRQYIASALVSLAKKHNLDLSSTTLGVVGVGNVGSKVATVGRALGMRVLLNDPPRARREGPAAFTDLDTLVREADIVTLHVPLQEDGPDATRHLFDAARLATMRPDQILINSSRGPVVDGAALKATLKNKGLRGAVLDVWEKEPDIDRELMSLLDFCTPHIAGYSADGKANGTAASVRKVAEVLGIEELKNWSPVAVPAPPQSLEFELAEEATVHATSPLQQLLSAAILHTYDIALDTAALRSSPEAFERLRGDYAVRREPEAFTATPGQASGQAREALVKLGFKIK